MFKRLGNKGFGAIEYLFIAMVVGLVVLVGYLVLTGSKEDPGSKPLANAGQSKNVLMTVEYSGGLCNNGACFSKYSLYSDGAFEDHKTLSANDTAKLSKLISDTDFSKYSPADEPDCPSAYDGSDLGLRFPGKYGDKLFKPCELNVPSNDPTFDTITGLISNHLKDK